MIRAGVFLAVFCVCGIAGKAQKVIDTLSTEACNCFENFLERSKLPVDDSLTNCITVSILYHAGSLSKHKKLSPSTVEGIKEIHTRVRKNLKKKCRVFNG